MPRRELKHPRQIEDWLIDWGQRIKHPGTMILIGSGALLWHAAQQGIETPLPENSMDVDPITDSDDIAALGYDAGIGSNFEKKNGWHINLMPWRALQGLPADWQTRAMTKKYGDLEIIVPMVADLLVPKLDRGEPRDLAHAEWAKNLGLC